VEGSAALRPVVRGVSNRERIFGSAVLASRRPDLLWSMFLACYLGAYLSDLVCYWLGRHYGPRLWRLKGFGRVVPQRHVKALARFYDRYGVRTLFVGRFVPFGVRNGLLLTAGLSQMRFIRLALADLGAATLSVSFFFWLYFTYGAKVIGIVQQSNLTLFIIAVLVALLFFVRRRLMRKMDAAAESQRVPEGIALDSKKHGGDPHT
jgi:membrane protein DedA with SNARE-associated domain